MLSILIILAQVWSCTTFDFGPQPSIDLCYFGQRQSPIIIEEEQVIRGPAKVNISFVNHNQNVYKMKFRSSDANRTLTVFADPDQKMHVILANHTGITVYRFHSMHFHWGCYEHSLSSDVVHTRTGLYVASMEMHFVYYNQAYGSYENARFQPNGLFTYAVLYRYYGGATSGHPYEAPFLQLFLDFLQNPGNPSEKVMKLTWFDALFYSTKKRDSLYVYEGSIASYPCTETVLWGINRNLKYMNWDQDAYFRDSFYNYNHTTIKSNCRHQQLRFGRKLYNISYEVTTDFSPDIPANREVALPSRPGEGEGGNRLPPNWLIYLIPAFILGGLTYMHRFFDWSFLDHLREETRSYT